MQSGNKTQKIQDGKSNLSDNSRKRNDESEDEEAVEDGEHHDHDEKSPPHKMIKFENTKSEEAKQKQANPMRNRVLKQLANREIHGRPIKKPDIFEQNHWEFLYKRDLKAHTGCVNAVDFSHNEEWIVSGGDDLKVRVWKTVDCCTHKSPASTSFTMKSIHHSNIFALRFSHKNERIYSAGNDHRLLVHDMKTRERLCTYRASSSIYTIATHPTDDNVIAASSEDRNVYLFDLRGNEGDGLCTKLRQDGCAYSVNWNPLNHNFVAVCNKNTGLLVYDLRMGSNNYVEAGKFTKRAVCADWSPDGNAIFCGISGSYPICFNMAISEHVQMTHPNYSNICTIKSCTFAGPNYMLTGSDDWNIYVWKMPTKWKWTICGGEEVPYSERAYTVLRGHRSIVNHVRFGERSNMLLSCGVEKIVKCWSPFELFDSHTVPKQREKLNTGNRLYSSYFDDQHGDDSNTEEDLSTLQRFDFYYEMQRQRERDNILNDISDEDSDSDNDLVLRVFSGGYEGIDEDDESFFGDVTSSGDEDEQSSPSAPSSIVGAEAEEMEPDEEE